jgi:hypothetical protein
MRRPSLVSASSATRSDRSLPMAPSSQRYPIGTAAEGVVPVEGEADELETTVLAALTEQMAIAGAELGGQPPNRRVLLQWSP